MESVNADEVRIPRRVRDALARHEEVVVLNRDRPAYVIMSPEDRRAASAGSPRRLLREALAILGEAAPPDPAFGEDMEAVLAMVGRAPGDPWARS